MRKVVLLGTEHPIQLGKSSPESFRSVLIEECEKNEVEAIAEEITKANDTIAIQLAADRQYKYLNADPGYTERMERGIKNNIEQDIINEYKNKHFEIAIWPRDANQETLPTEVWNEYSKRYEKAYRMHEKIWLEKIQEFDYWPLLFICGANHFEEFSKLLIASEFQVIESHKHWMPKSLDNLPKT